MKASTDDLTEITTGDGCCSFALGVRGRWCALASEISLPEGLKAGAFVHKLPSVVG